MRIPTRPALAGAALMMLCGCAAHDVRLRTGQALIGAELAVTGANLAARQAAESGACTGACAAKAEGLLGLANACVERASAAYGRDDDALAALTLPSCFSGLAEARSAVGEAP
jgi:hypothetical protein